MTAWIMAALLHQGQLQDVHIKATTVDKAVAQIGQIYHVALDASPFLRNTVVMIEASQASESDIRNQLATAVDSTWEVKDETLYLTQTSQQKKLQTKRDYDWRRKLLTWALDHRLSVANSTAPFTADMATRVMNQLNSSGRGGFFAINDASMGEPTSRFMTRFLKKFGVDRIAAIPNGQRRVFSTQPNSMQLPLGIDVQADIEQLHKESDLWKQAIMKGDRSKGEPEDQGDAGDFDKLANLVFIVNCDGVGNYELSIFGLTRNLHHVVFNTDASSMEGFFSVLTENDLKEMATTEAKSSAESVDFLKFIQWNRKGMSKDRISQMAELCKDPLVRDPLSFVCTESLMEQAKRLHRNIVAVLSDTAISQANLGMTDMLFDKRFATFFSDFVSIDDKWIRMMPWPGTGAPLPRKELKQFIRRAKDSAEFTIEDQAALAASRARNENYTDLIQLISAFPPVAHPVQNEQQWLRTLGLLSQSERVAAASPRGLPFGQLNSVLQSHLYDCAFNDRRMNLSPSGDQSIPDAENFMLSEPTFLAPTGISPESPFRIVTHREERFQQEDRDADGEVVPGECLTAERWGEMKYFAEHPELQLGQEFNPSTKVRRVLTVTYQFELIVNPKCSMRFEIHDMQNSGDNPVTLASLSGDYKKAFDEGYRKASLSKKGDGYVKVLPNISQRLIRSR